VEPAATATIQSPSVIFGDPWTDEQRRLADIVFRVWLDSDPARWPYFAYVEQEMYLRQADAREILASFPTVGGEAPLSQRYADVLYSRDLMVTSETRVQLSVAGLSKTSGGPDAARIFMHLLKVAGMTRRNAKLDPFTVTPVTISSTDFANEAAGLAPGLVSAMADLIRTEPPQVTGLSLASVNEAAGAWTASVEVGAARFAEGIAVGDYLSEVVSVLTPPPTEQPRVLPSPLGLLEALHYLNITWQRHCRRELLQVGNVAAAARLAFDVGNEDEFAARVSTFGDFMKWLQTHSASGVSGHPLDMLKAYLREQLPDSDDQGAAQQTIGTLRNVTLIRNGLQHSAAATKGLSAWQALGLPHPPTPWNPAWLTVRAIATEAVMDLRALVERLPVDGCSEHRK
jgi:hypothetical protein